MSRADPSAGGADDKMGRVTDNQSKAADTSAMGVDGDIYRLNLLLGSWVEL